MVSRPNFMLIILNVYLGPDLFLRAVRFTTDYVRLVGQEPAPSKCVLLSTFKAVRSEMRGWVLSDEGDRWTVKLDVRDLGRHLDTTLRGWSSTLSLRVRLVIYFCPSSWTFVGVFVLFVLCFCLVLFMVLRLLICLRVVY